MASNILLSVIVPAYNVAKWLPRCLDSILAQTHHNIEVIVIDDGSTDETPQIIDAYADRDQRIVAIHQSNRGLAETRNIGIRKAKGAFVGFVDGDDEIIPEMYETLLQNAVKYDAQISQCGILYCFYDGGRKPVHGTGEIMVFDRIAGCNALLRDDGMEPSLCNKLYAASILKDSCLDQTVINNEDMLRNIVLFDRAKRSVTEDFCGYLYWRRNDSMSHNQDAVKIGRNILKARRLILDYVPQEIKNTAESNYITGAINTYNSLIGKSSEEAFQLRKECIEILDKYRKTDIRVNHNTRLKIWMICLAPALYDTARKIHASRMDKKVKRQAFRAKEKTDGKEGRSWGR